MAKPNYDHVVKATIWTARITIWIAEALLIAGVLFLVTASRGGPVWMRLAGGLCLVAVLFMPTLLLILQPNLALVLINSILNLLGRRHTPSGDLIAAPPPSHIAQWGEMNTAEKTAVYLIALIGATLGTTILCYLAMPHSP